MSKEDKLTAEILNQIFEVRGSYYTLKYPGGALLSCRNSLEIFTKNLTEQPIVGTMPDAVFVLMNPGSSRPWDEEYVPPNYASNEITQKDGVPCVWTKALPDITQYQLMKVMTHMGWDYVRVSNLSDIRCPKSHKFRDLVKTLKGTDPDRLHSIFSEKRKVELDQILKIKPGAPIVLAWGKDDWLVEMAELGFRSLPPDNLRGVRGGKSEFLFSHASPSQQSHKDVWVREILRNLRK